MAMISALWTRRSTRATTQEALGKASPHSENGRLVVMMVDRFRLRPETMLNSRSAWRLPVRSHGALGLSCVAG